MKKMFLTLRNPKEAIKWDPKKPLSQYGEIGRGVIEIKPVVSQSGETKYFFGNTELQDGHWFVPNETGGYYVMTMDEIKNKYVIL